MYLTRVTGTITVHLRSPPSPKVVVDRIAQVLPRLGSQSIESTEMSVNFRNQVSLGAPRLPYAHVDSGEFSVEMRDGKIIVYYTLDVASGFVFISSLTTFVFIVIFVLILAGVSHHLENFYYPVGFWVVFYWGNFVILILRTRVMLRRCLT